ncbi:cell division cycle 20-like protein 1, cofactor of APC complex [Nematocida homosporus]|uniref:cell division cycle 20-like protein 1, cofactor of APC complex n=1 Tax=Nematocida homosporus TaxID=1912981 RepID=UPI002220979D|nr:cell division cycle 20-like protein 1, cofactor of APC complex [Nematocida homosporus]KAI5187182.1 cell division cycle 20-like protein 1, cofactor of APC complex [Nematocida homosporus]
MRRFMFFSEHSAISSDDFMEKYSLPKRGPAFAKEYERIFQDRLPMTLHQETPEKPEFVEKRAGPIRCTKVKGLADDFYSSLLDWQGSNIVFALDERVFVQNFLTSRISLIARLSSTYITSVKLSPDGSCIGAGTCTGDVAVIDLQGKIITRRHQHKSRIGVLEWDGRQMLTGSRDRSIRYIDPRSPEDPRAVIVHTQEVCGLAFSPTGAYLASGGNDNKVFVLDGRAHSSVVHTISAHKAAVKAIGWCPDRTDLLASGGGTADRTVKIWQIAGNLEKLLDSIDYGSQVCNLKWTKKNELITTHGYSQNDIRVLDVSKKKQTRVFEGHKNRVIHFGMSPDEEYFATGSGDETVCVWRARENDLANFPVR